MAVAYPTNPAPQRPLGVSPYASYAAFDPAAYAAEQKASLAAFNPQAYSAQVQQEQAARSAEREALDRYIAEQSAKGIETASLNATGGGPMGSSGVFGLPDFGPRFDPTNPTASTGQVFRFDTGSQVGSPGASGEMEYRSAAPVVFQPGQNYVLTDAASKKVLGSATTPEEMAELAEMSGNLPYGFQLFRGDEQGGYTSGKELFGKDDPRADGLMGALVNYGIPIGMSFLAGPLGPLASAAVAAGTAGATKLMSGHTPKDALIAAGVSGLTAGALKGITGPVSNGMSPFTGAARDAAVNAAAQAAAPMAAAPVAGEILVSAARQAAPSLLTNVASTAASGALSSALTNNASQYQPQPGDAPMVTGTGYRYPTDSLLTNTGSVLGAGLSGVGNALTSPPPPAYEQLPGETVDAEKLVTGDRAPDTGIPPITPPLAVQPTPEAPAAEDEIVVTANPDHPGSLEGLVAPLVTLGPSAIPGTAADATPKKKLGVSDYLRLAGLASTAFGALSGGDDTPAGTIPGGLGGLNPIFSSQLPTANIPGGVGAASNLAPRQMGEEDWLTYGQRPERSFFNYVPQQPTGMAHGGSLEAKRGGSSTRTSFAVNGPGTGRSDDIPAVLSDGEYVIDAETVALLGDGSSKAGAQKLDDLRVKIRKHKGQKLSQGRFSANAKKPEAYLSGGRI